MAAETLMLPAGAGSIFNGGHSSVPTTDGTTTTIWTFDPSNLGYDAGFLIEADVVGVLEGPRTAIYKLAAGVTWEVGVGIGLETPQSIVAFDPTSGLGGVALSTSGDTIILTVDGADATNVRWRARAYVMMERAP